ncbi:rCG57656 [Rattus norvegicus]|uniref:RCG57656 n=1 Tax=Rattus norvegicus TaxID=10116 RepID=A6JHI8_RAT|nr:rCG57656 [Rattus norvegicus]
MRLRQEDGHEFKAGLAYKARYYPNSLKKKKKKERERDC